jgi:hypothetical protein
MSLIGRVALGCVGPPGLLRFSVIVTGAFDPGRGCVSPPGFRAVNVGTVANGLKPGALVDPLPMVVTPG